MAGINIALREAVSDNNWNKHGHVQWLVETLVAVLGVIVPLAG